MNTTAQQLINHLNLQPHPEGGYYRETHRSPLILPHSILPSSYSGDRSAMTSILFLLPQGTRSRPHKVLSEELWIFNQGDPLLLTSRMDKFTNDDEPNVQHTILSNSPTAPNFQHLVKPNEWQAASPLPPTTTGPIHGYSLVSCIVAPGFDFADFEMIDSLQK